MVVALVTCFVLVPISALTIDLGMQRIARKDMQAVADSVALDMARNLAAGSTPTDAQASARAAASTGSIGSAPVLHVYTGYIAPSATFVSDQSLGCSGASSAHNGYFQDPVTAGKNANAVLVTASNSVNFAFHGGSGGVCRSAIAGIVGSACYDVGSYAAAVNTGHSALINPLMRQLAQQSGAFSNSATVMAIDYNGLAQSQVDLGRLAASLGLGSTNALATSSVKLHDFYVALLSAMTVPQDASNVAALNGLINTTSSSSTQINLGKILSVDSGSGSLATATMNLLDLVGGSLGVVNGVNVASLNIGSTLPGVANANAQVTLIQGPHHFCGIVGTRSSTATAANLTQQLGVTMTAQLTGNQSITLPPIPGLTSGSTTTSVPLPNNTTTTLSVAPTTTLLTAISCTTSSSVSMDVTNGLATVTFETDISNLQVPNVTLTGVIVGGLLKPSVVSTITLPSAHVKVVATLSPSGVVHFTIAVPPQRFDTAYPSSSTGLGLGPLQVTNLSPATAQVTVGIPPLVTVGMGVSLDASQQSQLTSAVLNAVISPMFDNTNPNSFVSTVVNPMLGLLGTDIGGSDITLDSKPVPGCNQPAMMG